MNKRPELWIATWFYFDQPGFLDFKYRIAAACKDFDVTLVLRDDVFRAEFADLPLRFEVLPTPQVGKFAMFGFIVRLACLLRQRKPQQTLLLGSQLALASFLLPKESALLYWNEHPTHFFRGITRHPLKVMLGSLLVHASFMAARRAAKVLPIGEAHRDDLLANGVKPQRLALQYMGVSERFVGLKSGAARLPDALHVVYTGTVQKARGRDLMLEGLAQARARGVPCSLTMVGAGPDELAYCRSRVEDLGIAGHVQLLGRVPGEEVPAYLQAADFGICVWEDQIWWRYNPPTKLFEYLVAGLPVLGSRIRTHTEYVHDGVNGFIFDYSAEDFAKVLERCWAARAEWSLMSLRAAEEAKARYLWSGIEPAFLAALNEGVVSGKQVSES